MMLFRFFIIGKEGRWLALEQQNGVWYWKIRDMRSEVHYNNWNRNSTDQFTRAITQYNTWKARQGSEHYSIICKSSLIKGKRQLTISSFVFMCRNYYCLKL